ncbi:MAG: hypothetical protein JJE04_07350 [Acidobacteriia bacterium]|nr:hypothetical protein [Terriglobia bacterium]
MVETPWLHLGLEQEWLGFEDEIHDRIDPEMRIAQQAQMDADTVLEYARDLLGPGRPSVGTIITEGPVFGARGPVGAIKGAPLAFLWSPPSEADIGGPCRCSAELHPCDGDPARVKTPITLNPSRGSRMIER